MNTDPFGIKYKFPTRSCKECRKYPCFQGIERCISDFAKYGCIYYGVQSPKNKIDS